MAFRAFLHSPIVASPNNSFIPRFLATTVVTHNTFSSVNLKKRSPSSFTSFRAQEQPKICHSWQKGLRERRMSLGTPKSTATSSMAPTSPQEPLAPVPQDGKVKVAVLQLMCGAEDKEANISHAKESILQAASQGARLIVLPEMWNCPYSNGSFPKYAENIDAGPESSPSTAMLSQAAKQTGTTVIGGSIPERSHGKLYNTCCVYGPQGQLLGKHRKTHLFDIDIPGKITFKESLTLTPGEGPTVVETEVGRIGIGICYDMRFPELAMLYAARGVHMICYPGAFNMTTGPVHWLLLQQARAVDNQLFVVSCSPARDVNAGYVAYGHSAVIGPFAEVLAQAGPEEETLYADIDLSQIETRRTNMPLGKQRRRDLYHLNDMTKEIYKRFMGKPDS